MPRAHPSNSSQQTAVDLQEQGHGCLFGFILPPLSVILASALFAFTILSKTAMAVPEKSTGISPSFTPEVQYWSASIQKWASLYELDPDLAATVMQIESCGNPRALSRSGAIGLFQVMPFHFTSNDDPYAPETNAVRGLAYLARSLEAAGGNPRLALAGYNGGIAVISRGEWTWSDQTRRYVYYGWPIYQDARNGLESSAMLMEWYDSYGRGLCAQAQQYLGFP